MYGLDHTGKMERIPIDRLRPRKRALRWVDRTHPEYILLRESIEKWGFIWEPLIVRPNGEILSGHNRYDIAKCLGWKDLPCHVVEVSDEQADRLEMEANAQKITPSPIAYTRRLLHIVRQHPDLSVPQLARLVHRSVSWIQDHLKLTRLNEEYLTWVYEGRMSTPNALTLAKLPPNQQDKLAQLARSLPHSQFAALVQSRLTQAVKRLSPKPSRNGVEFEPKLQPVSTLLEVYNDPKKLSRKIKSRKKLNVIREVLLWVFQMDERSLAARQRSRDRMKHKWKASDIRQAPWSK